MNAKQANSIALTSLLEKLGYHPAKTNNDDWFYLSPLRFEKTPSFHVNIRKNVWFDHGAGRGGGVVSFVCAHLQNSGEDYTVADALRWLDNMMPKIFEARSARESFTDATTKLIIKEVCPLQNKHLFQYLEKRGVPKALAKKYLKEVHVHNEVSRRNLFALGLRNEEKGYELRNAVFKGCVGTKTITFIRGTQPMTKDIHVFEGIFDFLSALLFFKTDKLPGDCIILNSVSCLRHAFAYINNYGYERMFTWMDNDAAGKRATLSLDAIAKQQVNLKHKPMNKIYTPYKDVNEWHMQPEQPKLK